MAPSAAATAEPLVRLDGLTVCFPDERGERLTPVVQDVSFAVGRNEEVEDVEALRPVVGDQAGVVASGVADDAAGFR